MPENAIYLGWIALLFPNATLVHVRRDPRDVALSCWMANFNSIRWANDPAQIAGRIREHRRLMEHWDRILPDRIGIYHVDYERLVEDLDGQARRLVAACGLEWEPSCLRFHETRRPVRTASKTQVRRPLYRSSVARWEALPRSSARALRPRAAAVTPPRDRARPAPDGPHRLTNAYTPRPSAARNHTPCRPNLFYRFREARLRGGPGIRTERSGEPFDQAIHPDFGETSMPSSPDPPRPRISPVARGAIPSRRRQAAARRRFSALVERLEDRVVMSTFTVTSTADSGPNTLRQAILDAAVDGEADTIVFDSNLAGQTITLTTSDADTDYGPTGVVIDDDNITIDGSDAPGLTISGDTVQRVFAVTGTGTLTLEDITLTGGWAQGGNGGNSSRGGGGGGGAGLGGAVFNEGTFSTYGVTFTNNVAQGGFGGFGGEGGDSGSTTGGGGGGMGVDGADGSEGGTGGGDGGSSPGGAAGFGGGGGGGGSSGAAAGGAGGFGGGGGGGYRAADYPGYGGAGGFGGGAGASVNPVVTGDGTAGGGGAGMGGGIFNNGGTVVLINDTLTGNSANGGEGGLVLGTGGAGEGYGGALFSRNGTVTAYYDTFSLNSVTNGDSIVGSGSDVYAVGDDAQPVVTLADDILAQSDAATVTTDIDSATINSGTLPSFAGSEDNIVSNNTGASGLPGEAVFSNLDPQLGALADNGGPTQTMQILFSSIAAGEATPVDYPGTSTPISVNQRGANRSATYPDIGAYSMAPTATLVSSASINATDASSSTTTVVIDYSTIINEAPLDTSTFGIGNITVSNGAEVTGFSANGDAVTYTITAPSDNWGDSTQGTYIIALVDSGVENVEGTGVRGDSVFGTFTVDAEPPTATLTSAPPVNVTDASGTTTTVTITYSDATAGVDTSTFGTGNITVSGGATVTGFSASGDAVTYTITAPSDDWGDSTQGAYTIGLVAGSVTDLVGNPIAGDASFGTFEVNTVAPTASLTSAPPITAADAAGTTTTVTITYSDATAGIDTSTFGTGNITVSNGATVTDYSVSGGVVTYTITAPSDNWGDSTEGAYTIGLVAGSVEDLAANPVAADVSFGSFTVDTVAPTASLTSAPAVTVADAAGTTTTVTVTYSDATSGVDASTFGLGNITVSNGAAVTGFSASGDAVTYTITAPADNWGDSSQGSYTIGLVAGSVTDLVGNPIAADASLGSLEVNTVAPTATLTSATAVTAVNAAGTTTTVTITYSDATSGVDPSTFGLGNITVSGGATVTGFSASGDAVTYTITAPSDNWGDSTQGNYTIGLVAGSVMDLAGNPIAADDSFGSFEVDTVAPSASLSSAPTVNATDASGATTTVTITYSDAASGVDTSTFGTGNITVSDGATVTGFSASGDAVTYTITAPADNWGDSTQGSYTISLVAGSVADLVGNPVAADPSFGSFEVDTVAPTASLTSAPTVIATDAAGTTTTVTITYSDATSGVDASTFGLGNITVSNGATVTGFSASGDAVTYIITAPSDDWGDSTQGSYTISLVAGSVADLAGNPIAADASFGSFEVDTVAPAATLTAAPAVTAADAAGTTTTVTITYSDATSGVDTSTFGLGNITVSNGATVTGFSASGDAVTYTITAPSDDWGDSTQGSYTIALVAGSVMDLVGNPIAADPSFGSLMVDTAPPTATLTSAPAVTAADASATTTTVTITYSDATSGVDTSTFGIGNITVSSGATVTGFSVSGDAVTYTITAPSDNWSDSTQGSYTIALVAGSVTDLVGNPIAADPSFGSFMVDITPPTATLTSAPAVTAADASASTTTVTVTFSDSTSGVDTSTFGTGNITVSNGATVTGFSVSGDAVTYTITAPSDQWGDSTQGSYTISLVAGSVTDLAGNGIAAVASLGAFDVTTVLPTAMLSSTPTLTAAEASETTTTVTITYIAGAAGIDATTFGTGNITVSNGATVTAFSATGDVVTYTITAPGSDWGSSPQGSYSVALVGGSVQDTVGNSVAADASFGSFTVDTAQLTLTTTTLLVSPGAPALGDPVTFSVSVTPASGSLVPSGSVSLFDGSDLIVTRPLVNGAASYVTSILPAGSHRFTAVYNGDASFATSPSSPSDLSIAQATSQGGSVDSSCAADLLRRGRDPHGYVHVDDQSECGPDDGDGPVLRRHGLPGQRAAGRHRRGRSTCRLARHACRAADHRHRPGEPANIGPRRRQPRHHRGLLGRFQLRRIDVADAGHGPGPAGHDRHEPHVVE